MMQTTKPARDLVLLLQGLADREQTPDALEAASERVLQASSRVVEPSVVQRLEYAGYEVDWLGAGTKILQGLATVESQLLLTEIVDQLGALGDEELSPLPAELGLTPEQLRASCFAAYWILNSLEWESRDRAIPAEFPAEKRKSMLAACLRSLQSFRKTGEP